MGFSERMRVNPIFFPDTTRLQIPNFANRDTTIRKDYQEHLPKSLFLTSPNKLKKNQTRQVEPSSQMQSPKVKTAESNSSNTRMETHNFNALSIRKWLHQVEKSPNESNHSIWDYLFPGLVFPTESTLIRKDSNSSAFVGIHNENQQVYFSFLYSSDRFGELGFLFRVDLSGENTVEIMGEFSNEAARDNFIKHWQTTPQNFISTIQTFVVMHNPPNGNYG